MRKSLKSSKTRLRRSKSRTSTFVRQIKQTAATGTQTPCCPQTIRRVSGGIQTQTRRPRYFPIVPLEACFRASINTHRMSYLSRVCAISPRASSSQPVTSLHGLWKVKFNAVETTTAQCLMEKERRGERGQRSCYFNEVIMNGVR